MCKIKYFIDLGLEDDDLFLNFDADEIPKSNVIRFLKIHDGIPPVFQFNLRWTVYTFYWAHLTPEKQITKSKQKKNKQYFYSFYNRTLFTCFKSVILLPFFYIYRFLNC